MSRIDKKFVYPEILHIMKPPITTVAPTQQAEGGLWELRNHHFTTAIIIMCFINFAMKGVALWYSYTNFHLKLKKCSAQFGFGGLKIAATIAMLILTLRMEDGKMKRDYVSCSIMAFFSVIAYPALHFLHVFLLAQCMSGRFLLSGKVERVCGFRNCFIALSCICLGAILIAFVSIHLDPLLIWMDWYDNVLVRMFIFLTTYLTTFLFAYRICEGKMDHAEDAKRAGMLMTVPHTPLASFAIFSSVFVGYSLLSPYGDSGKKLSDLVHLLMFQVWCCIDSLLINFHIQRGEMNRSAGREEGIEKIVVWNTYSKGASQRSTCVF